MSSHRAGGASAPLAQTGRMRANGGRLPGAARVPRSRRTGTAGWQTKMPGILEVHKPKGSAARQGTETPHVQQMTHQKLQVPPCPRRAGGHAWLLASEHSTRECEADACQACGLVRITSYRTGQVVGYRSADDGSRTGSRPEENEDEPAAREQPPAEANELPSVALTTRFLALCQRYGSEQLAVRIVAAGRSTGVPGLPPGNDWTAWNTDEMRAAVEALAAQAGSVTPEAQYSAARAALLR